MAVGGYDEDLLLNPFYKAFVSREKELYNTAAENRWTICIPRKGAASKSSFNRQCFETHILKPLDGDRTDALATMNGQEVQIKGSMIVTSRGFEEVQSVKILFEETFFNRKEESYHVLCIEQLLDAAPSSSSQTSLQIVQLETLQSCNEFLWAKSSNNRCRNRLNELIQLFNSSSKRKEVKSLRVSVDAANTLFTNAMEVCLKESYFRKPASVDAVYMDKLKVAVETYIMEGIHDLVFKDVSSLLAERDAQFNKTTRNLSDLQLSDLNVNENICKNVTKCKKIISTVNNFNSPLEKLHVLKLTIVAMSESSGKTTGECAVTTDDILPALIFLIIKCPIPNWHANLNYIQDFHFSNAKMDEFQFYLASTEAAIEHIQSGRLDSMISMTHTQRMKTFCSLLLQGVNLNINEKSKIQSPVDALFKKIYNHDVEGVMSTLKESAANMTQITKSLCHPLCSCNMCERILASRQHDNANVTVFSRDSIGCTALHQAAECGCEEIIYELIKKGAEVNATNHHGSTAIHFACQRGHHKCIVLMSHYGGDVNMVDSAVNTPLHLAATNGHQLCVDFLLSDDCRTRSSSDVDIDATNEDGDTALHIASRWGFAEIVLSLLKQGAKTNIKNNKDYAPLECALNDRIKDIFSESTSPRSLVKENLGSLPTSMSEMTSSENINAGYVLTESPTTTRRKREFSNLLKAIADGNTEMVREKLGVCKLHDPHYVEPPPYTSIDAVEQLLCHPLCQCDKCATLQRKVISDMVTLNANSSNSEGVSPLHIAAIHGFEDIVTILLKECAADPNVKTKLNQRTPLHLACQYNNIECVSLLLKNGARVNLKDNNGNTALHFCCTNGHIGPAILLLQGGANVHSLNHRGNTPLHDAVRWDYLDITKLLLHYKAPLNVLNKMSLTPLQYARGGDVRILLQRANSEDSVNVTVEPESSKFKRDSVQFHSQQVQKNLFSTDEEEVACDGTENDKGAGPSSKNTYCVKNSSVGIRSKGAFSVATTYSNETNEHLKHIAHDVRTLRDDDLSSPSLCNASVSRCDVSISCKNVSVEADGAFEVSVDGDTLHTTAGQFDFCSRIAELINEAIDDDDIV